jgi:hypothetical protein
MIDHDLETYFLPTVVRCDSPEHLWARRALQGLPGAA